MKILKYKGKTEEIILSQIQKEHGERATVLHTQKEEASGVFKWFKSPCFIMTVAVKDENTLALEKEENSIENNTFEQTLSKQQTNEKQEDILKQKEEIQKIAQMVKAEKALSHKAPVLEKKEEKSKSPLSLEDKKEENDNIELLKALKAELNLLHKEIGSLKQGEKPQQPSLKEWASDQLQNLGIKREVCQKLLANIQTEDSEQFIRLLYHSLEEMIQVKTENSEAKVIFFVGSTGVGKTTTIAKLTAKYVLDSQKQIVLFTSDTYRIAAVEQLKTYADILGVAIEVIYDEKDLPYYLEKWHHADYILIDTAGRSHKNVEQIQELDALMQSVPNKQVYLVLNASTSACDIQSITNVYGQMVTDFDLIVTKLDETDEIGNIVNISYYGNHAIRYVTNGQNVPADIETFDKDSFMTQLLGRISNGSSV